jgi:DNA polymerase V
MRVLADFTPALEFYSIDEAFLGLGGFEHRLEAHARELRARVQQWTGIPVSVGIAATKTLAKVANHRAKKDPACQGVCVMLENLARGMTDMLEALDRKRGKGPAGTCWKSCPAGTNTEPTLNGWKPAS